MFTENEKKTAKALVENDEFMRLLGKVLLPNQDEWLKKMPVGVPDADFAQYVKACLLAEEKIKERFGTLQRIAYVEQTGTSAVAPK